MTNPITIKFIRPTQEVFLIYNGPMDSTHPKTTDSIIIGGLELKCRVGDTPEERSFPQLINVHIQVFVPLKKAGVSDDIAHTLDYARLIQQIQLLVQEKEFNLVEAVGESLAGLILKHPGVTGVSIRVTKKSFPGIAAVGVHLWRENV